MLADLAKSDTRFGKNSPKSATRLVQKVPKSYRWTNKKMLLEGLITNYPGKKMGQHNFQKVPKNAKKTQNMFYLINTVRKVLSEVQP